MRSATALAVQCRPEFEAAVGVRAAILFGSVARGQANSSSDVDIAVVGEGVDILALGARLGAAVGCDVDVVEVSFASPIPLLRSLLRDGRVVYERAPGQGIDFLARARVVNELDAPGYDRMMSRFMNRVARNGVGL
jgi:predicted nucleotidyltransferase